MAVKETEVQSEGTRYQFGLRTLFVATTCVALVSGFAHYLGGTYLLRQSLFIVFTILTFLFLCVGPLLVTEFLTFVIDWTFGLSTRSPMPGRRRFQ